MRDDFHGRKPALCMCRNGTSSARIARYAARLQLLQGQGAWSVVFVCQPLQDFHYTVVLAFADKEFGCFFKTDDSDSKDGHDEDECTVCIPHISPALVVIVGAGNTSCTTAIGVVGKESPGKEACNQLSNA